MYGQSYSLYISSLFFYQYNGVISPSIFFIFFVVFRCFLPTYECDHLLGSLITLKVICWEITLALFIIFIFLPEQWLCITITIDYCYCMSSVFVYYPTMSVTTCFLSFSFVSSLRMSATTTYNHLSHMKDFDERSYWSYTPVSVRLRGVTFYTYFI